MTEQEKQLNHLMLSMVTLVQTNILYAMKDCFDKKAKFDLNVAANHNRKFIRNMEKEIAKVDNTIPEAMDDLGAFSYELMRESCKCVNRNELMALVRAYNAGEVAVKYDEA